MAAITTEFLIIFLFIFALTFGALRIANVFKGMKAINAIIALVIAFFAATYQPFVTALWSYLPMLSWFFVIVFLIGILLELKNKILPKGTSPASKSTTVIITAMAMLVFLTIGVSFIPNLSFIDQDNLYMLIGLVFLVGLFLAAGSLGDPNLPPPPKQ